MADNEVHPVLSKQEMDEIAVYRQQFAYKTVARSEQMLYDWTRTGKITQREHVLLSKYLYQGF